MPGLALEGIAQAAQQLVFLLNAITVLPADDVTRATNYIFSDWISGAQYQVAEGGIDRFWINHRVNKFTGLGIFVVSEGCTDTNIIRQRRCICSGNIGITLVCVGCIVQEWLHGKGKLFVAQTKHGFTTC